MKKFIIPLLFAAAISSQTHAQVILSVEITDLKSDNGKVMLELFDATHKTVGSKAMHIKDKKATMMFENLKPGKYAARFFHDENNNDKLDTNFLGIPNEGYGFSNNAYGTFGPKPFEEWLVDVSKDTKIVLKTKN
ncbi:MAG: DUF2141 domain-containing protein [Bacteroidetes bacterium]|nr:DUF2141 domain-containing protein [Bacteroidota bacterium]